MAMPDGHKRRRQLTPYRVFGVLGGALSARMYQISGINGVKMMRQERIVYRYEFDDSCPMAEIGETLLLSRAASESLWGEARVRLEASFSIDENAQSAVIGATSIVGQQFNVLFAGFLIREFGNSSFRVSRLEIRPIEEKQPREGLE